MMSRRDEILTCISNSPEYNNIVSRIARHSDLEADLYQEAMLVLMELPEAKVVQIWDGNYFKFWFTRIVLNLFRSKSSRFYFKFVRGLGNASIDEDPETYNSRPYDTGEDYDPGIERLLSQSLRCVDSIYWYDRDIFKLYLRHGSMKEVSAITHIPYRSVVDTVHTVRQVLTIKFKRHD